MTEQKYRLINYFDVWGNEQDGWEVNNLCTVGEYTLKGFTDEALLSFLINDAVFLQKHVTLGDIEFSQDSYEMIEFTKKSNGIPLGRFELVA